MPKTPQQFGMARLLVPSMSPSGPFRPFAATRQHVRSRRISRHAENFAKSTRLTHLGHTAGLGAGATRQKRAKGLDLRRHKIGEGPHSGGVLHVTVHEQVVGHQHAYTIDDANKLSLI